VQNADDFDPAFYGTVEDEIIGRSVDPPDTQSGEKRIGRVSLLAQTRRSKAERTRIRAK
jgi:hypothetical protein